MCLLLLYVHNNYNMTCFIHLNFLIPTVMKLSFCMQICYFKIIQSSETEPILHVMIVCEELLTHYKYKCQTQPIPRLSLLGLKRPGMSTILH